MDHFASQGPEDPECGCWSICNRRSKVLDTKLLGVEEISVGRKSLLSDWLSRTMDQRTLLRWAISRDFTVYRSQCYSTRRLPLCNDRSWWPTKSLVTMWQHSLEVEQRLGTPPFHVPLKNRAERYTNYRVSSQFRVVSNAITNHEFLNDKLSIFVAALVRTIYSRPRRSFSELECMEFGLNLVNSSLIRDLLLLRKPANKWGVVCTCNRWI